MGSNLETVKSYLGAIEGGAVGAELARHFAPDVVQEEFPNRLVPAGARRDLAAILASAARGQQILRAQRFQILGALESGDSIALEVQWTGTLAVALGTLAPDAEMRARFAVFIELRDGKIVRQRNYDCFEAF